MVTKFSQLSLVLGGLCAIASTPFIFESLPGKTQTPATPTSSPIPSSTAVPTPNPEAIPTLTPGTAPAMPTSTPTVSPQPTPTLSPESEPTPTVPVSPQPTPTTPPPSSTPPASEGSSLSRYSASNAPILRVGSQGQAVRDVQAFLKEVGIYSGPVDGVYGPQTQAAVESFQKSKNLASDGIIGPQTWAAMLGS